MQLHTVLWVLVLLYISVCGSAQADKREPPRHRDSTGERTKQRVPATRTNLNALDSGVETAGDNTEPPDKVSEQTRREVERQRTQREARKKRQKENREKRQKRMDELNRKARNKEIYRVMTANLWVILLCVVMFCGCLYALNDLRCVAQCTIGYYLPSP